MSYRAKVIKVMIASPSDVANERQVIRNVIQEWNFTHSEDRNIVLMPVGWESHASPAVGDRPQAIINKQVLEDCDLLIAVFWTKVGTPTGRAISGTVEEIEEHVRAKKPAMIYFSLVPVLLESVDREQYLALKDFKEELGKRGLYSEYDSIEDFRAKLSRQLAQTVIRYFASKKNGNGEDVEGDMAAPSLPDLSESARRLLIEAANDQRGTILRVPSGKSLSVETNGKNFTEPRGDDRGSRWEKALKDLQKAGLVQDQGRRSEVFSVTNEGYRVANLVRERQYA